MLKSSYYRYIYEHYSFREVKFVFLKYENSKMEHYLRDRVPEPQVVEHRPQEPQTPQEQKSSGNGEQ
mgnify:CR=1 FL=1